MENKVQQWQKPVLRRMSLNDALASFMGDGEDYGFYS